MNPNDVTPTTEDRRDIRPAVPLSANKLAANRRNARKSTGPRSVTGKVASRMNAVRHGILSSAVVVRGLRIQEHAEEFQALRKECWKCLAPVGRVEEILADKIVTAQWRLRRALIAETGEIVKSVDGSRQRRENRRPLPLGLFRDPLQDGAAQMERSSHGLDYLKAVLRLVRVDVESEGELTQATCDQVLERFMNAPNSLTRELLEYRERMTADVSSLSKDSAYATAAADKSAIAEVSASAAVPADREGLSLEEVKECHQRAVLRFIEGKLAWYEELSRQSEEREDKAETAQQAADVLPSTEVLQKIMRYEGALNRELYRAMNQLERLQRRRDGEKVAAPLMMDVMK